MNVYLFAIGGTGARVLRSLTFCLASGMECIPDGTTFIPMIIDYDKTNGDKTRLIEDLDLYSRIRQRAYNGIELDEGERNFFLPEIKYLSDVGSRENVNQVQLAPSYEFTFGIDTNKQTGSFADFMDYRDMVGATSLTRDLISSLYNDEPVSSSQTELNLNLSKGFVGNPNIGSIVFENIRKDAEFKRFLSAFDPKKDRAFIISSIFGGTGSAGFPRIVDAIRYCGIADFDSALLGASIVMPYFKVNTPRGGAIHSNIFNSKQKAALSYYQEPDSTGRSLFAKLTASYFIADDDATTFPYCEGNVGQKNDAHIVELLAALSIIDFVSTDEATLRTRKRQNQSEREYGLPVDTIPTKSIELADFCKDDRDKYLSFLCRMALAFRYYEKYVVTQDINPREAYYSAQGLDLMTKVGQDQMYKDFEQFIADFNSWLDELACQKDSFKPFLHNPRDNESQVPVAEDLDDYIAGYQAKHGSLFSKGGSSYKDFSGYCNDYFKQYGKNLDNEDFAFLSLFYDAAKDCFDSYQQIH